MTTDGTANGGDGGTPNGARGLTTEANGAAGARGGRRSTLRTEYGLPATTTSTEALRLYDQGVRELLEFGAGAGDLFQRAVALDAGFALAYVMVGVMEFLAERYDAARRWTAHAESLLPHLTSWERRHVNALCRFVEGNAAESARLMAEVIRDEPRDILLINRLFFMEFWRGRSKAMLDLTSRVIDRYPGDSYALSMHAFALEENGRYGPALAAGETAVRANPRNGWAVHAIAHIHYEQGTHQSGATYLPPAIAVCDHLGYFRTHLIWHLALFELANGHYGRVGELYRQGIRARGFEMPAEVHDAASLLWRLRLYGDDPPPTLWTELAHAVHGRVGRPQILFHQLHLSMALAGAGDEAMLARHRDYLTSLAAKGGPAAEVGLPLHDGLVAYARGDYATAANTLGPIEDRIIDVGGSHAQREVFHDTLLESLLRTGQMDSAEARLRRRLEHLPAIARNWYRLGVAQAARGDSTAARASLARVLDYWRDADPTAPERANAQRLLATLGT